jgi:hypothetical protein
MFAWSAFIHIVLSLSRHQVLLADMNAIGLTSVTPEFVHKVLQADEVHPKKPAGALAGYEFATFSRFEIAASKYDTHSCVCPLLSPQLLSFTEVMHAVTQ